MGFPAIINCMKFSVADVNGVAPPSEKRFHGLGAADLHGNFTLSRLYDLDG
jgi:hypothetical protein